MVDYNEIPDNEIDIESPATEYVKRRLRDNPLAMASGDAGLVYNRDSFARYAAGEIQMATPTAYLSITTGTPFKFFSFICPVVGTLRIKFTMYVTLGDGLIYGQIYINGVAAGVQRSTSSLTPVEFVEDILIDPARVSIQLYGWGSNTLGQIGAFGLYAESSWQFTNEIV